MKTAKSMEMTLPYAHLNLRRNPFGEFDPSERASTALADVEDVIWKLRRPGFAAQFIDDKGHGKTSHLLAIHKYFPEAPYVHVREGEDPDIPCGQPLFLDECQRIPRWKRRKIFKRKVSFVIASHENHEAELRHAGFDVRTIRPSACLNAEGLQVIFQRRIEWVRRGPGAVPTIRPQTAKWLAAIFDGDVRSMESYLYEVFQSMKEITRV